MIAEVWNLHHACVTKLKFLIWEGLKSFPSSWMNKWQMGRGHSFGWCRERNAHSHQLHMGKVSEVNRLWRNRCMAEDKCEGGERGRAREQGWVSEWLVVNYTLNLLKQNGSIWALLRRTGSRGVGIFNERLVVWRKTLLGIHCKQGGVLGPGLKADV